MVNPRYASLLIASVAVLVACDDSTGPRPDDSGKIATFHWTGQIEPGRTVEVKGLQGDIRASRAAGSALRLTARKIGDRDDPASVRIEVIEHPGGVTICAVYPDVPGQLPNSCEPGFLRGHLSSRDNDVEVAFDVEVPQGADFAGHTIAGNVRASGLDGDVVASALAGDIDVSTTGVAIGSTQKGDVTASIGSTDWDRDLSFRSLSGNIEVRIPSGTNARVWATARGSIRTDFPLTVTRQGAFRHMSGTLGGGGRDLMLSTSDGDIVLRSD